MSLTLDYQTLRKTQQQQSIALLEQLSLTSAALREVRAQKYALFEQPQLLCGKRSTFNEQWQAFSTEEITLLQEFCAILTQLASLRESFLTKEAIIIP